MTTNNGDLWGLWNDPATDNLYLNTYLSVTAVSTNTLSGDDNDIFICVSILLGATTNCTFSLFRDGDAHGWNNDIDALHIAGGVPPVAANLLDLTGRTRLESDKIYLPLVAGDDGAAAVSGEDGSDVANKGEEKEREPETNQLYLPIITR